MASGSIRSHVEETEDEENVIRYACGYVGMKLYNRFMKQKSNKAGIFVEIVDQMYVDGPESSLLEYSRMWVERVNRGGLFDVSDEAYLLFYAIEEAVIEKLTSHIRKSVFLTSDESEQRMKVIIEEVLGDCDVQYRCSITHH